MVVSVPVFFFYYYLVVMVAGTANTLQNQGNFPDNMPCNEA
jgi:hypothetical protein